jgi:hypothetical protein
MSLKERSESGTSRKGEETKENPEKGPDELGSEQETCLRRKNRA